MPTFEPVDFDPFGQRGAIPTEGTALLNAIAGGESPGYDTLYGGSKFSDFTVHPRKMIPITSGPNAGKFSSAAGRYQFLGSTWDDVQNDLSLPDFSPGSQDQAAWHLAQKTYKQKTGRELLADLQKTKGNPAAVESIGRYLSGTWTSLPGGIEPNKATGGFGQRYASSLSPTEMSAQSRGPKFEPVDHDPFSEETTGGGRFADSLGQNFRVAREGESPAVASAGQAFGGGVLKGGTFNFVDELAGTLAAGGYDPNDPVSLNNATALLRGIYKRMTGDSDADATYRVTTSAVREALERQREQQPAASVTGEIGGALLTAPLAGPAARGLSLAQRGIQGAKAGAIYGGLSGAGEGTDLESRASGAATGATIGAPIGAVAGAVVPPIVNAIASPFTRGSRTAVPTIEELKNAAKAGYQSAEIKGLTVDASTVTNLSRTVQTELNKIGIDENLAPKVFGILSKLEKAPPGAVSTGENLVTLRKMFGKAAGSIDPTERLAAKEAQKLLDDFMENIPASNVLSGDAAAASKALKTANANYSAAMQSSNIDQKTVRAELRAAAANSGQNVANTVRQRMADILINPKERRGYTAAELKQMERIVRGTITQNTARFAGNVMGGGGGLGMLAAGTAGALATGGWGVAAPAVGFALKALGNRLTLKEVERLSQAVRARSPLGNSMAAFGTKAQAFQKLQTPAAFAAVSLASRNLSNNLKDAGISLAPSDILRALQGPVAGRAEDEQPN